MQTRINTKTRIIHSFLSACFIMLLLASCDDKPSTLGGDFFPGDEIISSHSLKYNLEASNSGSMAVDSKFPNTFLLGEINDPSFGYTKADFVSEFFVYHGEALKRDELYTLDSVNLVIKYKDNYWIGDPLAKHKLKVYKYDSRLSTLDNYKSNIVIDDDYDASSPIGELSFCMKDTEADTMWNYNKKRDQEYIKELSIKINDEYAQELFKASKDMLSSPGEFKNEFNGLYFTTEKEDSKEGSILRIDYLNLPPQLEFHYRRKIYDETLNDAIIIDTAKFYPSFDIFGKEEVKFNRFKHEYDNSPIDDPTTQSLYVQPMGGNVPVITFKDDFVAAWKDSLNKTKPKLGIAEVSLRLDIDTTLTKYRDYPVPSQLVFYKKNKDGKLEQIIFENEYQNLLSGIKSCELMPLYNKNNEQYPGYYLVTFTRGFFEEFVNPSNSKNEEYLSFKEIYFTPIGNESTLSSVALKNIESIDGNNITDSNENNHPALTIKYVKYY